MVAAHTSDEDEEDFVLTVEILFDYVGPVQRQNYRRTWTGDDYRFKCGKYRNVLLSTLQDQKYLLWCLNRFDNELPHNLSRALIDQFNSLHS